MCSVFDLQYLRVENKGKKNPVKFYTNLKETGAQEGQMCWNICEYSVFLSFQKLILFVENNPPKHSNKTKKNKPLILFFNITSSIADTMLFTKHAF